MRAKLVFIVFFIAVLCFGNQSCTTGPGDQPVKSTTPADVKDASYDYSVYLENSGSLNGYLNVSGSGSFRDAVYSLLTGINGFPQKRSLNLYDINTQVIPVARNASASALDKYISQLDAASFAKRSQASGGDQSKSDLRQVIKNVLDSSNSKKVSLLISDFIFSPGKNADALNFLSQQKAGVQGYFQERLQTDSVSALLLQFYSDFDGNYYDQTNTAVSGHFSKRPYYMLCVGPESALKGMLDYVTNRFSDRGYQNFLFLASTKSYNVNPTIRLNTSYYDYEPEHPLHIDHAQKGGSDGKFRVFIKVNYAGLPLSEAELKDPANYELSPGFQLEDLKMLPESTGGFTHEIVLVADKAAKGELQVALKAGLPSWIAASDLKSDKGLSAEELEGKTFGLSSLTQGMYEAYFGREARPRYFVFDIEIKD